MRELNWKSGQAVEVSVLGNQAAPVEGQPARIVEFSGKRMRVASRLKIAGGAAVRLEWDGQLLLGEVLSTLPDGFWLEIHHMLLDSAKPGWQENGRQRG